MTTSSIALALWLGLQTSLLPCPLATNIAAVSFVGRKLGSARQVFAAGLLYTLGRALTYTVIALLLVEGLLAQREVAHFLETHLNRALGPALILTGMFLLGLLELPGTGVGGHAERLQAAVDKLGLFGALPLGIAFALAFCPPSAALYFLTLIPLCVKVQSSLLLPGLFGLGTALPVIAFAFLIAFSAQSLGTVFNRLNQVERWARAVTGGLFVAVGIYYALTFIFRLWA